MENLIFASRIVMLCRSRGQWVGWPGPNVKEGEPIPESDPADTSPTAGLLSSQVHNTNSISLLIFAFYHERSIDPLTMY